MREVIEMIQKEAEKSGRSPESLIKELIIETRTKLETKIKQPLTSLSSFQQAQNQ